MENRLTIVKKAFIAAFPHTIPIFAGFWFLGMAYGIYMNVSGFSFLYTLIMSMFIFAGSMEFVTVSLLLGAFNPLQALLLTLMINARHLFYGISMLDKYRHTGWKKPYLIFGMCDESFSINYTARIPQGIDRNWFMFFVTFLNHIYWVSGALLGCLFGSFIHFNTQGLEFVMTAMFVLVVACSPRNDAEIRIEKNFVGKVRLDEIYDEISFVPLRFAESAPVANVYQSVVAEGKIFLNTNSTETNI